MRTSRTKDLRTILDLGLDFFLTIDPFLDSSLDKINFKKKSK